jgi:hypothetical protein
MREAHSRRTMRSSANRSGAVMQEWLRNQEWSAELWVAAWVAVMVFISIVWTYGKHLKR